MRKKIIFLFLISLIVSICSPSSSKALVTNLISNPNVETASTDPKVPLDWEIGQWGSNQTTFTYVSNGSNGGVLGLKSLYIKMSSYTDGDAKWYFKPVGVLPETQYSFSDYYRSSVVTSTVVQITDTSGNNSYIWLGNNAKTGRWIKSSYIFTTPANASQATVFHIISSVGYLYTDNFILLEKDISVPVVDNVPNNSVEKSNELTPEAPMGWQTGGWGTNTASFTYLNSGHTGTRSIKTQITAYTDGDAKWYYTPQNIKPGDYKFTDYYKSNVATSVIVWVIKNDGTNAYLGLKPVPATSNWMKYSDIFTLPADTKQISVFHILTGVGYLITDDYSVTPYQAQGFSRALISLTFDDAWDDTMANAFPIMNQYDYKCTQYITTEYILGDYEKQQIKDMYNAGHEIGSHSITHPFLTQVTASQLTDELLNSKKILESIIGSGKVNSFSTPYGDYNSTVIAAIKKYYKSNRNTDDSWNSKENFDIYNIRVQNMTKNTTFAEFTSWVNKAKQDKTWLVIVYHGINNAPRDYDTLISDFTNQMKYISDSGVVVRPTTAALSELVPQL